MLASCADRPLLIWKSVLVTSLFCQLGRAGSREAWGAAWGLQQAVAGLGPNFSFTPVLSGQCSPLLQIPVGDLTPLLRFHSLWFLPLGAEQETFSLVQSDGGGVSVRVKTWGSLLRTLAALRLGSPKGFPSEFGFLPFPLPLLSLSTLCFESLMAAQTETSGRGTSGVFECGAGFSDPLWVRAGGVGCCGPGCLALWSEFCRPHPALPLPRGEGLATWHLYARLYCSCEPKRK